jgi:hydroxypyruvate isomerase
MKLGVCLELFFTKQPFEERIKLAGKAGFKHAEIWFLEGKDPARLAAAARQAGVTLTNAVIGSPDGKIGGGLTDPRRRQEWLRRADETFAFCRAAGIGACIVCTGNVIPGKSRRAMRRSVVDGLKATLPQAAAAGIELWLEPLNDKIDHADYFCCGSDEGADICREVGSPRLKMLFDCYHLQIMEGDLLGHLRRNLDVIAHLHSAGHPGRHELWLGETNYPFLVREIAKLGYRGVFALEYIPTLESDKSLRKTREYLGN